MEYKILPFSENLSYNFEFFPAAYLTIRPLHIILNISTQKWML